MSSFIFKKFEEPPNPDRLCNEDDRRLFFWDGDGTGGQADNWGTTDPDGIDALFYEKLDGLGPNDQLNQLLSVDSQGRVVNYYSFDGVSAEPDERAIGTVDLQMFRSSSDQIAFGNHSSLLGGLNNRAAGARSSVIGGNDNVASNNNTVVLGGQNNQANSANSVILGGDGLESNNENTAVAQNLQLQGGAATSSFFAVTTSGTATNQATIQIREDVSAVDIDFDSDDPDGTIIVLRNSSTIDTISFVNAIPFGGIVNRPGDLGSASSINLPPSSSAILFKQGLNLVVISFYNPANYNSDGTLNT